MHIDTDNLLHWNRNLDNPNNSEDNCAADIESDIEQDNGIYNAECPGQQDVSGMPNVPGLIRPTRNSKSQVEKVLVTVNAIATRRNKRVKNK